MKLRNKKTGEIADVESLGHANSMKKENGYQVTLSWAIAGFENLSQCKDYRSLAELNEEWEDYKPVEPLIEDEKARKFVRDWAEHWGIDKVVIRFIDNNRIDLIGFPSSTGTGREIDIQRTVVRNEIIHGNRYTITELCGKEAA